MDENQSKALPLKAAYIFGTAHGLQQEVEAIQNMAIKWESSYTSTVRRGYIVALFQKNNIFEKFRTDYWLFGTTKDGEAKLRFYNRVREEYEEFLSRNTESGESSESEDAESDMGFVLESHLHAFLVANLGRIETGLTLYEKGGKTGDEYPIDDNKGRIDILAVDSKGLLVVIELKVGRGRNRTVGQLLYYMGWVNKNLKSGCRGMIIAKEISNDLLLAIEGIQNVDAYSYNLIFDLKRRLS